MPYFTDKKIFDDSSELWNSDDLTAKIDETLETQHELSHRQIINELLAVQEITIENISELVAAGTVSTTGILEAIDTLQTQNATQATQITTLQTENTTQAAQIADLIARVTDLETP